MSYVGLPEKHEDCPRCSEVERWNYDGQICAACGLNDPYCKRCGGTHYVMVGVRCPDCRDIEATLPRAARTA